MDYMLVGKNRIQKKKYENQGKSSLSFSSKMAEAARMEEGAAAGTTIQRVQGGMDRSCRLLDKVSTRDKFWWCWYMQEAAAPAYLGWWRARWCHC